MVQKTLIFLAQSIAVGIIAAALLIFLMPADWLQSRRAATVPGDDDAARPMETRPEPSSYSQAVARAAPAVVNIYTKKQIQGRRRFSTNNPQLEYLLRNIYGHRVDRTVTSLGSGVIVTPQGHILTNNHVIENAEEIEVFLRDGRPLTASGDLAVLHIHTRDVPNIAFGNSSALAVGDVVLAIGNPFGLGQTVSQGIISATGRNQLGINVFENYIQTDAAINPGNSGGALINARGELIGINTITSSSNGNSVGIGFAIPILLAQQVMAHMIEYGYVLRGWIGIRMQNISPQLSESFGLTESGGVLVSGVVRDGPAHAAGLYPGDIITYINKRPIMQERQVLDEIIQYRPRQTLTIRGLRRGRSVEWRVQVGQRPVYGASTY